MRLRPFLAVSSVLLAGLAFAMPVAAAQQGSEGATSKGSILISATVANRTQVTGDSDVALAQADSEQSECVWSNTVTRLYAINATGNGRDGAFQLADGAAYHVLWAARSDAQTPSRLAPGTTLAGLSSAAATPGCTADPASKARLLVSPASASAAATGGAHGGDLTMLLIPE